MNTRKFPNTRNRARAFAYCVALAFSTIASPAIADNPLLRIDTNRGAIDIELYADRSPKTTENFLKLVEQNFFDGLIFHRVIANFVIQTGGYDHELTYREWPDKLENESLNGLQNLTGTLAMARTADPDSADSQFFINMNNNAHLDSAPDRPGYTVFGRVVAGMKVAQDIELSDTHIQNGMVGVPEKPIVIQSVTRIEPATGSGQSE